MIYDGEAVRDGEMDVADLAPALLAVGHMAQAIGRVALGENAGVKVRVKTLKEGSFDIWLDVGVTWWHTMRDMLTGADVNAAKTLVELLFGSTVGVGGIGVGVIAFVKWLRGKKPSSVVRNDDGTVTVNLDDVEITVSDAVFRISMTQAVRDALERTIADPLEKDGIETVEFKRSADQSTMIEKNDAAFFRAPAITVDGMIETKHIKGNYPPPMARIFAVSGHDFEDGLEGVRAL